MKQKKSIESAAIEAATREFKNYGFQCNNPKITKPDPKKQNSPITKIEFDAEPATGMAWFSQKEVQVSILYWSENLIELRVRYTHHDGGSNGIDRQFVILADKDWPNDGYSVYLIPNGVYIKTIHHYHNQKNDPIKP